MGPKPFLKRTVSTLLLLFSTVFISYGQTFKQFIESDDIDTKCGIAQELALEYVVSDLDSLRMLGESLLKFSNKLHSKKGINMSYYLIGNYLTRTAKEKEGMGLLRQAKNYYLSIENYSLVTSVLNEIGNAYQYLGKYEEACKWYKQSLKYGEFSSDEYAMNAAQINLAQAYNHLEKYEEAKEQAEQYRDWVLKLGSLKSSSNAFAVLGSIELNQGKNKQAIYYFEQCYKFAVRAGDNSGQGHAYTNIGIAKYLEGNMDESERYFKEALEFRKSVRNVAMTCDAYLNYGGILYERGNNEGAIENYEAGLNLARNHKKYTNEIEFLEALKELYADFDPKKIEGFNHDIEVAQKLQTYFDQDQQKIDEVLASELRESDKIRKSGFVSESNRWPFYIGASILFAGFFFLVVRKKIN